MESPASESAVCIVTRDPSKEPVSRLQKRLEHPVTVVESVSAVRTHLESDDGRPDVIAVCESDEAWVRSVLQAGVSKVGSAPKLIVAPPEGSEWLATVAIRHGADDYVPLTSFDAAVSRIDAHASNPLARRGVQQPLSAAIELLATTLPDEVFVIREDGTYLESNVRPDSADLYTVTPSEMAGSTLWDAFPEAEADRLYASLERALETNSIERIEYEGETIEGIRQFEGRIVPVDLPERAERAVIWLAHDYTGREHRRDALQQRRDQLELFNRINAVVREVIETLVEAPTQSTVETEVCEQLVASDLYSGSWVSRPAGNGDVVYQTGAGQAQSYLEAIQELDLDLDRPIPKALRENRIYSSNELLTDPAMPDRLVEAAREHDLQSAIAVPLSHGDTVYGVLTVLARRRDAFGTREREAFQFLGETIGFAISAIKNRRLLFADAVTLLEFTIEGGDSFSLDLSRRYECTCELEWSGTTASGKTYQYVRVDGVDGDTVYEAASSHDSVEECRLIHSDEEGATIEIRLAESAVRTLMGYGATIREITVEDGVGYITVEVSRETDTREIVEALQRVYENTELAAKREADRPVMTAADRRNRIADRLTDRQLTALRLAYYGGYFDWPRGSTGEDVADAMGVSPPTMHQHLRRGLEEILHDFFDEERMNPGR